MSASLCISPNYTNLESATLLRHASAADVTGLQFCPGGAGGGRGDRGGGAGENDEGREPEDDGRFDVLHATAAALIDALQDVLLDAEFENAMGALTGTVPVGREDVLMRVVQREFEGRQKRRRKGR